MTHSGIESETSWKAVILVNHCAMASLICLTRLQRPSIPYALACFVVGLVCSMSVCNSCLVHTTKRLRKTRHKISRPKKITSSESTWKCFRVSITHKCFSMCRNASNHWVEQNRKAFLKWGVFYLFCPPKKRNTSAGTIKMVLSFKTKRNFRTTYVDTPSACSYIPKWVPNFDYHGRAKNT